MPPVQSWILLRAVRSTPASMPPRTIRFVPRAALRRAFHPNRRQHGLREVYGPEPVPPANLCDPVAMHRYDSVRKAYWWRRQKVAMAGAVFCMTAAMLVALNLPKPIQNDAPTQLPGSEPITPAINHPFRDTGTTSVPFFPKSIRLPISAASSGRIATDPTPALPAGTALPGLEGNMEELTLLGLGIRTVSFLSIQVYVVGLYVATADLAALQSRLVKAGASVEGASTLVGPEVDDLRKKLLDPQASTEIWDTILRADGIRSVVRVAPTRKTDYSHLRDGWVTGITARSGNMGKGIGGEKFDDEKFGQAIQTFKAMFGRKALAKGRVMLLERDASGRLVGWEESSDPGKTRVDPTKMDTRLQRMGEVDDERLSRLIWLGYLAGGKVSSEEARRDIVEGVMELATRPVGTVETQVV